MATRKGQGNAAGRPRSSERSSETTLEEFLVACQKSLSRSLRAAEEASRAEAGFVAGQRTLYAIDGLAFDLSVGVGAADGAGMLPDRVILDFNAPGDQRSRVSFRVSSRPLDALQEPLLLLANLNPLGELGPQARLRGRIVNPDPAVEIESTRLDFHFARPGGSGVLGTVSGQTDMQGQVTVRIDPEASHVEVEGGVTEEVTSLGAADRYYIWATAVLSSGKTLRSETLSLSTQR